MNSGWHSHSAAWTTCSRSMSDLDDVQVRVYRRTGLGERKLASATVCDESLAHDELSDMLHAAGVEEPERAILEGSPVLDGGACYEISWEVEYLDRKEEPNG